MMIEKVLIAEDHESTTISLQKTMEGLRIKEAEYVHYCDDAMMLIQKAIQIRSPYDLLITDLYFEKDHRLQKIEGGIQLVTEARKIQPDLKVLVFSAETRPAVIETLFNNPEIDGFVRKARHDAKELIQAINNIDKNQRHFPIHLTRLIKDKNSYEFSKFDIIVVSLLAKGMRQRDIPQYLRQHKIKPLGLSSVEKRINRMKDALHCRNNEQLVIYCKDMGIVV